jgi:tetratricopeptide (TPR) repeat protein
MRVNREDVSQRSLGRIQVPAHHTVQAHREPFAIRASRFLHEKYPFCPIAFRFFAPDDEASPFASAPIWRAAVADLQPRTAATKGRVRPEPSSLAEQVLTHAQSGREVIQDYCPLAESLEWELGQQYFRERGNKAFISDAIPVPFLINNDGTLSRNAAEVFFASCQAADKAGGLEDEIFVLELGIGVGLFARFFLDNFRDLCREHQKNYYDRLCYIAGDLSERMLHDMLRHGVLANHPARYCIRVINAMEPDKHLPYDAMFHGRMGKPLRAVFLNYLLDCLPAAILEFDRDGNDVKQMCVRTCLARNVKLADHTDMSVEALRLRVKANDQKSRDELMEVYGLFASEYDYRPAVPGMIAYGKFAVEFGRGHGKRLMHNYGAIQALERLLGMLHPNGFILMNEYGMTDVGREDEYEHQRFSFATAVGLNFPLLKAYFMEHPDKPAWVEPFSGEGRGIETRLLSHRPANETVVAFHERFQPARFQHLDEPVQKARACLKAGRFEMAANFYKEALKRQPRNWYLMGEIASFLTFQMRDLKAAIDMAKVALELNPSCSADLWNILGDALYEFGRTAEGKSAYLQALSVNTSDVRSRHNLAWVYTREKDYAAALQMIADALAHDKTGQLRDRLLQKQQEVLALAAIQHQQEYLLYVNFVSRDAKRKDEEEDPLSRTPEKKD